MKSRIFNDRLKKSNYKIIDDGDGADDRKYIIKFKVIFNIWVSLKEQDFKSNFFNTTNRYKIYLGILLFSIILPFIVHPIFMTTYLFYMIFIPLELINNSVSSFEYESLDHVSSKIDEIIKEQKKPKIKMMFDDDGNKIIGEKLERIQKFNRLI